MQDDASGTFRDLDDWERQQLAESFRQVEQWFRQAVQDQREQASWSQARLARELASIGMRVDATAITRIERGQRNIRLDEAWALAAVLRFPIEAFLPVTSVDLKLRVDLEEGMVRSARHELEMHAQQLAEREAELKRLKQLLRQAEKREQKP